jgi:hypothetical protein
MSAETVYRRRQKPPLATGRKAPEGMDFQACGYVDNFCRKPSIADRKPSITDRQPSIADKFPSIADTLAD